MTRAVHESGWPFGTIEEFREEWVRLRDRTLERPSRVSLHKFRRSCRKWQAILDLEEELPRKPSCRRVSRDLRRCLRISRDLRNADVMEKYLRDHKIALSLSFSYKKARRDLREVLRTERACREKDFRKCSEFLEKCVKVPSFLENIDLDRRETVAYHDLRQAYGQWLCDQARDFEPIHRIRIRLKKIAGQRTFLGKGPGSDNDQFEGHIKDLKKILRLLGRMSDLTMISESAPDLKGPRAEKDRLSRLLLDAQRDTGERIGLFLQYLKRK